MVLNYNKRNDCKIFHSRAKLIASDSNIDQAIKVMHQSIMEKVINSASEDWIVIDRIVKRSISKQKLIEIISSLLQFYTNQVFVFREHKQ